MNVSEIKQEILDLLILNGRKPQTIKTGERVVYLYDALNIVNKEFSKTEQPQLNENQQAWINRLTINFSWYDKTAQHALYATLQEPGMPDLPQNEFVQVLEVFSKWTQDQEEE